MLRELRTSHSREEEGKDREQGGRKETEVEQSILST